MRSHVCQFMHRSEEGLTLIESLVAIVIIGIVLAAIAPPLLIAAATRVQNQRTEQAMQLAQGEINRIRLIVERGSYEKAELPPITNATSIKDAPPPTRDTNGYIANSAAITVTRGFTVDIDNNGSADFVVQLFRKAGITSSGVENPNSTSSIPNAFQMGVRVYEYQAFQTGGSSALSTKRTLLRLTSQSNLQHPLAVLYTTVARNDLPMSLEEYRQLLNTN
ncbi:prepilin-type N-terminal cleavage/methylation domain-containing protein [Chroogloeocystis siderophila]|nr:prepilin-type N-terminal cleavage/methylation domain-containing protein [Chroogloeocystis siderophila]